MNTTTNSAARPPSFRKTRIGAAIALSVAALAVTGCGDDDDPVSVGSDTGMNTDGADPGPMGAVPTGAFAVARNASGVPGSVWFFSPDLQTQAGALASGANEGIAFDRAGRLFQNGDGAAFTGLRAFGRVDIGDTGNRFNPNGDRDLGAGKGKGLTVVDAAGLLVSCDVTDADADIKIYATTAGSGAAPVATVNTEAPVWDVFYDPGADRLYATQTDGVLLVFDDFTQNVGSGPSRALTPVDADGAKVSVNLHGVYAEDGRVVVTDVGDAASASDGALFVFTDDGSIDGSLGNVVRIAGDATALGNPVDVVLEDDSAIVAEKSNDALLVFNGVGGRAGNVAPDYRFEFAKPESIERVVSGDGVTDATDLESVAGVARVAVSLNPGPQQGGTNEAVGSIKMLDGNLADLGSFDAGDVGGTPGAQSFRTLENIQFDGLGNAVAVYDTTDGSAVSERGILVLHQLADRAGQTTDVPDRDRTIGGQPLGLASPKGIEIVQSRGAMIVADTGAGLRVLSLAAGDGAQPLFSVTAVGAGSIWDVDYDPDADRLYAAGTAGDIIVYDDFFALGPAAIPSRMIRPATAGAVSNIHGIVHVASSDQIIASDVGDAGVATDGRLYVIDNASTASGTVAPRSTVFGQETMLGNPVDIAFDGTRLYVAEKSNDKLLMYARILSLSGAVSTAADRSVDLPKPESVSLMPR